MSVPSEVACLEIKNNVAIKTTQIPCSFKCICEVHETYLFKVIYVDSSGDLCQFEQIFLHTLD